MDSKVEVESYSSEQLTGLLTSNKAPKAHRTRRTKYYQPAATKAWTLISFMFLIAICIALLAFTEKTRYTTNDSVSVLRRSTQDRMQSDHSPLLATLLGASVESKLVAGLPRLKERIRRQDSTSFDTASTDNTLLSDPTASTTTPVTSAASADNELLLSTPTTSTPQLEASTGAPNSELLLSTPTSSTPDSGTSAAAPNSELLLSTPTTSTPDSGTSSVMAISELILSTPPASTVSSSSVAPSSVPPNSQLLISSQSVSTVQTLFSPAASSDDPAFSNQGVSTTPTVVFTATSTNELSFSSSTLMGPKISPTPGSPPSGDELSTSKNKNFAKSDYFLALYLPTLVGVMIQSLWSIVFAATKMMEPFYQLARSGGAPAKDSLLAEYLSSGLSMYSLRTIFGGHWVMLVAGIIHLVIAVAVPLAGESMIVEPTQLCQISPSKQQPCAPIWLVNRPVIRILQLLLAVLFLLVLLLILLNRKRISGVLSDPSKISIMAKLLGHPGVMADLQNINPSATKSDVDKALGNNQYKLTTYQGSDGRPRYGIVKLFHGANNASFIPGGYQPVLRPKNDNENAPKASRKAVFFRDLGYLLAILGLFAIVLTYYFLSGDDPLNNFLNSKSFGPRFLLTFSAVIIGSGWKRIEREVRIMDPYRSLAGYSTKSRETLEASMTGTPFTTVFISLSRGHYFTTLVACVAILSEILIIAIAGVPFSSAQILMAYRVSTFTSLSILGLMVIVLIAVLVRRQGDPQMPRSPDTLAHVWLYLCASRMVERSNDRESLDTGFEDSHSQRSDLYWFDYATGVDGRNRWMIDADLHGRASE